MRTACDTVGNRDLKKKAHPNASSPLSLIVRADDNSNDVQKLKEAAIARLCDLYVKER